MDSAGVQALLDVHLEDGSWLFLDSAHTVKGQDLAAACVACFATGTLEPVKTLVKRAPYHAMLLLPGPSWSLRVAGSASPVWRDGVLQHPDTRTCVSMLLVGESEASVDLGPGGAIDVFNHGPGRERTAAFPAVPPPGAPWETGRGGVMPYEAVITLPPWHFVVLTHGPWVPDSAVWDRVNTSHEAWKRCSRRGTPACIPGPGVAARDMDPDFAWLDEEPGRDLPTVPSLTFCVCPKRL